eukprot:2411944-Rhodomonas_salina.1
MPSTPARKHARRSGAHQPESNSAGGEGTEGERQWMGVFRVSAEKTRQVAGGGRRDEDAGGERGKEWGNGENRSDGER